MIRSLLIAAFMMPVVLVPVFGPAWGGEPAGDVQDLRELMIERLAVMEYVAAYKWNQGLPVEDRKREARVLTETVSRVGGVDAERIARAIKAQIEAAKLVQSRLFEQWDAANRDRNEAVPDLQVSLRPRIGRMSNALIASVLAAQDELETCAALDVLGPVPRGLAQTPEAWKVAVAGVLDLKQPCTSAP